MQASEAAKYFGGEFGSWESGDGIHPTLLD